MKVFAPAFGIFTLSVVAVIAIADPLTIQGSNTLRLENYDNSGDPNNSPFAFTGLQGFDEFNLNARQRLSAYSKWQAQLNGVFSESEFRQQQRGELIIERANLKGEYGAGLLPVRAELGDYQAFFSLGTLQRSLKGARIEVQPDFGGQLRHSLQVIAGVNEPEWRKLNDNKDRTVGLSWLAADENLGDISFSWVHNQRLLNSNLKQNTLSLGGRTLWSMLSRQWDLETEVSYFSGDHTAITGLDRSEFGFFMQLAGKQANGKGNYRFRFDRYGQDYRPNGAVVSSNRLSAEAHGSWRFDAGIHARGRLQYFRDALESGNPTETRTVGMNLSGNLLGQYFNHVNGSLAGFVQFTENDDSTVSRRVESMNLNLSFPIIAGWTGRSGASFVRVVDNRGAGDSQTHNYTLGVSRRLNWYGFNGQISPNISFRKAISAKTSFDYNMGFAANINKDNHSLGMNFGFNFNRPGQQAADSHTRNIALNYRYIYGSSILGVEYTQNYRDPDNAASSTGEKISIFWTYSFDKTFAQKPVQSGTSYVASGSGLDLLNFAIGKRLADIESIQNQSFNEFGGFLIRETTLFSDSDQRQRLVIKRSIDAVDFAAVIIDFDDTGSLNSVQQIFEQMRRTLVNRYGAPDSFFDRGEFDANFVQNVNNESFIRIMEWNKGNGVLRFGIPRRLDGFVRMELHYAKRFNNPTDTFWSVEEVQ